MEIEKESVLKLIENNWPVNVPEIADRLQILPRDDNEYGEVHQMISNCLTELANEQRIILKEIGEFKVAYPTEIKKVGWR